MQLLHLLLVGPALIQNGLRVKRSPLTQFQPTFASTTTIEFIEQWLVNHPRSVAVLPELIRQPHQFLFTCSSKPHTSAHDRADCLRCRRQETPVERVLQWIREGRSLVDLGGTALPLGRPRKLRPATGTADVSSPQRRLRCPVSLLKRFETNCYFLTF